MWDVNVYKLLHMYIRTYLVTGRKLYLQIPCLKDTSTQRIFPVGVVCALFHMQALFKSSCTIIAKSDLHGYNITSRNLILISISNDTINTICNNVLIPSFIFSTTFKGRKETLCSTYYTIYVPIFPFG